VFPWKFYSITLNEAFPLMIFWMISQRLPKNRRLAFLNQPANYSLQGISPNFMKPLLDENIPKRLKEEFPDHENYTFRDMLCNSIKTASCSHEWLKMPLRSFLLLTKPYNINKTFGNTGLAYPFDFFR
jgi:hypothetical protein